MICYVRVAKNDAELRARLEELAAERRRFGFRRLAVLLRRDGMVVNIKRVLRIYREANLQVRKRVRRRVALGRGSPAVAVTVMNERWSLDFVHDSLESGRRIRTLNIVDDFTRECLAIEVDTSLSGSSRGSSPRRDRSGPRLSSNLAHGQRHRTNRNCYGVLGSRSASSAALHRPG